MKHHGRWCPMSRKDTIRAAPSYPCTAPCGHPAKLLGRQPGDSVSSWWLDWHRVSMNISGATQNPQAPGSEAPSTETLQGQISYYHEATVSVPQFTAQQDHLELSDAVSPRKQG